MIILIAIAHFVIKKVRLIKKKRFSVIFVVLGILATSSDFMWIMMMQLEFYTPSLQSEKSAKLSIISKMFQTIGYFTYFLINSQYTLNLWALTLNLRVARGLSLIYDVQKLKFSVFALLLMTILIAVTWLWIDILD